MSTQPILDRDTLSAAIAGGSAVKWIVFWGHTPPPDGRIGRHVLSQWWPAPFEGMGQADEHATDPARWRGANLLGFALMSARALLRSE
jgi:predicted NAD-dependent protein-ADP-ribosyltransferase YbiA (DUF1768 family)